MIRRAALTALAVLAAAGPGCGRSERGVRRDAGVATSAAPTSSAQASPTPPPASQPRFGPPVGYVGSARCGECHRAEHAAWRTDWHARALAPATGGAVIGDFRGAHFTGTSSEAWMTTRAGRPTVRTRGSDGALGDHPVAWVIGGKRMQDDLTVMADGRWQILPIYFHVTTREWVDYNEIKQGPITPAHPFFWANVRRMANHECLDCHTTGLAVGYDEAARRWQTRFADAGVACESCHGPGARHAESTEAEDIFHPGEAPPAQGLAVCAQCHTPRKPLLSSTLGS